MKIRTIYLTLIRIDMTRTIKRIKFRICKYFYNIQFFPHEIIMNYVCVFEMNIAITYYYNRKY